jgi:hypothetical protein
MRSAAAAIAWVGLAVAALGGLAACGDDPRDPRATVEEAQAAFAEKDGERLCALLSKRAARVMGHAAHAKPTTCERDIRRYLKWMRPHGPKQGTAPPRIARVAVGDDRAAATVRQPNGAVVSVPLVEEGGEWKVDGLFEASLSRIQVRGDDSPAEDRLTPVDPPVPAPVAGDALRIAAAGGGSGRCRPVRTADFPRLAGGCAIDVEAADGLDISVLSAFGVMPFSRCGVSFVIRTAGTGDAWIEDLSVTGGSPCFDALPCLDREREKIPWRGRLRQRDGQLELSVADACIDTCLGRFVGPWTVALSETRRGWRVRADEAMVGATGWRFDGALESPRKAFTVAG